MCFPGYSLLWIDRVLGFVGRSESNEKLENLLNFCSVHFPPRLWCNFINSLVCFSAIIFCGLLGLGFVDRSESNEKLENLWQGKTLKLILAEDYYNRPAACHDINFDIIRNADHVFC